jgi:hypothetical protein
VATLNINIPRFYCLLRKEFLYDGTRHHGEHVPICVFGASSVYGRAIGFHVLTENGAVIWRLPLHALCHKADAAAKPLDWLQLWDCFSYDVSCTTFERLAESRVQVRLKDNSWLGGQYMFTLDWFGHEDAEEAGDGGHKCAHIVALDDGNFAAQPNNRLGWFCPAFVTPFREKPDFLTNTRVWKVEREQETSPGFFYEAGSAESGEQLRLYCKGMRAFQAPAAAQPGS